MLQLLSSHFVFNDLTNVFFLQFTRTFGLTPDSRGSTSQFFTQNFWQNSEYFGEFLPSA